MNYFGVIDEDLNNGEGIRTTIFISGCKHDCKGCHSPESHDFDYGKLFTKEEQIKVLEKVRANELLDGITISGGDPLYSFEDISKFLSLSKKYLRKDQNVWLYTGYSFDEVRKLVFKYNDATLFDVVDVLVTEPFMLEKRNPELSFIGSSNQMIIHIDRKAVKRK